MIKHSKSGRKYMRKTEQKNGNKGINMKHSHKLITVIILLILFSFCLIIWLIVTYCTRYSFVEDYYFSNKEKFGDISTNFKELYSDNLCNAKLDGDSEKLELHYKFSKDNNDFIYSTEINDSSGKSFVDALNQLQEQYKANSEYPVFSYVDAYYDNDGNMLLYMQVFKKDIETKANEKEIVCYYLVYIDEGYHGNGSSIGIDKFGVTRNSFADNWSVWSETQMLN